MSECNIVDNTGLVELIERGLRKGHWDKALIPELKKRFKELKKKEKLLKLYEELAYYRSRVIHKLLDEVACLTDSETTKEEDIKYILDEAKSYGSEDYRILEEIKKIKENDK